MNDSIDKTVNAFSNLNDGDWEQLVDINTRIQSHKGAWGKSQGGDTDQDGVMQMPYWVSDPLVTEFVTYMYASELIVNFDWSAWDKGREWYKSTDKTKYDTLDIPTALKLLTAVIRNDRFSDGALVSAFESGDFPKIINKLVGLREK